MLPILLGAVALSKPVFVGVSAVAAGAVGYLIMRGDSRVEARRKDAIRLGQLASENGLPHTNELLSAYAVGDYSGVVGAMGSLYSTLTDDAQREAALQVFLGKQLDKRLSDPSRLSDLAAAFEKRGFTLTKKAA